MLRADKLKLQVLEVLRKEGDMTLGELKRATSVRHHYTLTASLEFLEKIGLIKVEKKGDKLGSKVVKLK